MAELEDVGKGSTLRKAFGVVLAFFILILIGVLAFSIRLFSVIKYESVIHEFDPYFNYRVTQYLTKNRVYDFWNWFDDRTWYPLGRVIGGTVYPGLTLTAGSIWWVLNNLNIPLSVETACFLPLSDASSFVILYLVTSVYFSGVMVQLMLVLAPVACIMFGIALSEAFDVFTQSVKFRSSGLLLNPPSVAGDTTFGNVAPENDVVNADKNSAGFKSEEVTKEWPSKKNKRKEKDSVEKAPVKAKPGKRLLVLPLEASALAIVLLIIMGAFYVV